MYPKYVVTNPVFWYLELNREKEEFEQPEEEAHEPEFYNKTKSFFDNISCEATDRAEG